MSMNLMQEVVGFCSVPYYDSITNNIEKAMKITLAYAFFWRKRLENNQLVFGQTVSQIKNKLAN